MAEEAKIEKYLCRRVKEQGGEVRKVRWVGRRGAPDRLVMLPGKEHFAHPDFPPLLRPPLTVYVELKAPGKTPEAHQLREHERLRRYGQRVEIVDSIAGVDALLKELDI